jgi:hypothetical protein
MTHLQMERDYNPRLANEELAKLIKYEAIEQGLSKKKKKRDKQLSEADEPDDLFGALFDETEGKSTNPKLSQASVVRDMSYNGWSGKSPKQFLMVSFCFNSRTGYPRIIEEQRLISHRSTMGSQDSDSKSHSLAVGWKR